jgi:hypothetical protein
LAAVRIELVHQMRGDLDLATVEIIFSSHPFRVVRDRRTSLFFEFRNGRLFRRNLFAVSPESVISCSVTSAGSPSKSGSAKSRVAEPV